MNAIKTLVAASSPGKHTPTMATMNWQIIMPIAPEIISDLRPNFSIVHRASGVEHTFTRVVMSVIRKTFSMVPRSWKKTVPAPC